MIGSRLWELAAGVLLFQVSPGVARMPTLARRIVAWGGVLLLAFTLVKAGTSRFPAPHPLLSVVATAALIAGLHEDRHAWLARALGTHPMTWVGRTSYSLYLWHWPVFVLMRWTSGIETALQVVLAIAATFALAALSSRLVEQPIRYSPMLQRWPRIAVVAAGVVLVGASWVVGTKIAAVRSRISLSTVTHNVDEWHSNPDATLPERPGCSLGIESTETGDVKRVTVMTFFSKGCATPRHPRRGSS